MRRPSILMVGGAILGVIGAGLVLTYVRDVEAQAADGEAMATVYVAREPIAAGTAGDDLGALVERQEIPRKFVPGDALTTLKSVEEHYALGRLDEGEPLRARDFGAAGVTEGDLAIPEGMEAVAVTVTLDGGVARYPVPGDHVNVFATFREGQKAVTQRILADVEVLATQPRPGASPKGMSSGESVQLVYLLAVAPEDSGVVVFGKEIGSVWLSLVPDGQESPDVEPIVFDLEELLGSTASQDGSEQ